MNPSKQTNLYGLDNYFIEIKKLYDSNKIPNKILFSGKQGSGKSTLAYHFINYILSQHEEDKYDINKLIINEKNRSFNLLNNNSHPNFYLIDLLEEKKNIEINQVREMITYTRKSSFNNIPRFVLIDNVEKLNLNSSNALLKVIEEPNDDIFFILIHNDKKKILPTLKSRCLTFKISLSFKKTIEITNYLLKNNIFSLINSDLINFYYSPGDFINMLGFAGEKKIDLTKHDITSFLHLLIDNSYYKKNKYVKGLIFDYIELYFLKIYRLSKSKEIILNTYHKFVNKVANANRFNLDDESLFIEFKSSVLDG